MRANLERLRRFMAEAGVDAVIATSPENVTYLSDYYCMSQWYNKGTQAYAVVAVDDTVAPFLVLPTLEIDSLAESPSWIADPRPYGIFYRDFLPAEELTLAEDKRIVALCARATPQAGAIQMLVQTLKERGLAGATLALDETGLLPSLQQAIVAELPQARIVEGAGILGRTRWVKAPAEIDRLAHSAHINEEALAAAIAALAPGVREQDVVNLFKSELAKRGGTPGFWMISAGVRSGHVHFLPSDYVLREGDLVKFDVGGSVDLYWADMARTKAVSRATEEQQRVYGALLAGEQAAIQAIRAGVRAADVFGIAVETVRASGLPGYQRTHCGHGIGIALYDPPLIQPSDARTDIALIGRTDVALEAGMVLCIETPYYLLGRWGMTVEDTVVVREDGADLLTSLDRGLSR